MPLPAGAVRRPGRSDGDAPERPRYAFYPFGGGSRACIGREFALLEGTLVLARALSRCRLDPVSPPRDAALGVNSAVTMTPRRHPAMAPVWRT